MGVDHESPDRRVRKPRLSRGQTCRGRRGMGKRDPPQQSKRQRERCPLAHSTRKRCRMAAHHTPSPAFETRLPKRWHCLAPPRNRPARGVWSSMATRLSRMQSVLHHIPQRHSNLRGHLRQSSRERRQSTHLSQRHRKTRQKHPPHQATRLLRKHGHYRRKVLHRPLQSQPRNHPTHG